MKYEYALLHWKGDGPGQQREIVYSHRAKAGKISGNALADTLRHMGEEGWQMVSAMPLVAGMTGSTLIAFQRPL